jgi:hypothetical protein
MSAQPQTVKPGDLITAESWNALVALLSDFEVRLATLEASATPLAPVLVRREPLGAVEPGSHVTLVGKNFLQPSEQNTVTLGNAQIRQFAAGSDDEHLVFEVPDVFTGLPLALPLAVHNVHGDSAPLIVSVLEHVEPQSGEVVFTPRTAAGQSPLPGQTLVLEWDVDSRTALPETYALSAVWINPVGASQALWTQSTTIAPASAKIAPGQPRRVTLTVVVPAGAQTVDVALVATAQEHAGLTKSSGPVHVEAGQPLPVSDPRTPMTLKPVPPGTDDHPPVPNPARAATISGTSGVEVQLGREAMLFVAANITVDGKYVFSTEVEQGGAAWAARIEPATATPPAGTTRQLVVHVRNTESAAGPARFMVVRATKRNAGDTADEFVSFVRFPLGGFVQ